MAEQKDDKNNNGNGNGADPVKNDNPTPTQFDPKTLSNEDLNKIFEDPRIWEHKRFKELNTDAKAGKKALEKLEEMENKSLEEQGKYKELAEKEKQKADDALAKLNQERINNVIMAEATKAGAVDLEAVQKLVDRNVIQVGEDGTITGATEAVKGLLESKPYLINANANPTPTMPGTAPSNQDTGVKKFTLSQIQEPKFYAEHKDEIQAAYKTGNIVDDSSQGQAPAGPMGPQS